MTPTYLQLLDEFPPFVCWALARKARKALSQKDLMQRTGWSSGKVQRFCKLRTWATVTVHDADLFRTACGVDRKSERRQRAYIKRTLDVTQTASGLRHFGAHGANAVKTLLQ